MSEAGRRAPQVFLRVFRSDELDGATVRPVLLSISATGRPLEALVLRDEDGEVRAYLNRCQHLPIPLDGGSREFLSADGRALMCGTHGALYRRRDGYCTEGPCEGDSLEPVCLRVDEAGWVHLALE